MVILDFRTDFVARPTPAMIDAMTKAAREQPEFGLREDPTVARLEAKAAELLGTEDALFCPTCTQANQIAIHLRCRPGESVLAEALSHIFLSECGAPAALSGALAVPVPGRHGVMLHREVQQAIRTGDASRSRTALIVIENTHVFSGGRAVPLDSMRSICDIARENRVPVHVDGARLFNAAAALRCSARALASCADSIAISLNKGLAAPMGAILAGSRDFIRDAVRVRQMFGGGWRPANILAAAGIVALDTMIDRLADDHRNARRLAIGLAGCRGVSIDAQAVETNIVMVEIDEAVIKTADLVAQLKARGILVMPISVGSTNVLRFVTHHDIGIAEIERSLATVIEIMGAAHPAVI